MGRAKCCAGYDYGKDGGTKSDEFSKKFQKGGESFSIQKVDFGNFKQDFLSMKLIQKSTFRVQGMFFSSIIVLKKSTQDTL